MTKFSSSDLVLFDLPSDLTESWIFKVMIYLYQNHIISLTIIFYLKTKYFNVGHDWFFFIKEKNNTKLIIIINNLPLNTMVNALSKHSILFLNKNNLNFE